MPIYPQLHGNIYKEPEEEERERELEEKKSNQELEWKRQLEEAKRREIMQERIQKATGPALPATREAGEPGQEREIPGGSPGTIPETSGTEERGRETETPGLAEAEAQNIPEQVPEGIETQPQQEMETQDQGKEGEAEDTGYKRGGARTSATPQKDKKEGQKAPSGVTSALAPGAIKKQASAALLKASWINVITSFGLTLFYIAFHFIGAYIARMSWFCKFGEEWVPAQASQVIGAAGETGAKAKKGLEYVEIVVFFLCITLYIGLIFLMLFIIFAPIFVMWQAYEAGVDFAKSVLNAITFGLVEK